MSRHWPGTRKALLRRRAWSIHMAADVAEKRCNLNVSGMSCLTGVPVSRVETGYAIGVKDGEVLSRTVPSDECSMR